MELEELKNRWSSLEDQLKKQEILNEKLIQEIRQTRTGPLSVLLKYSYLGIFVMIAVLALVVYFWTLRSYDTYGIIVLAYAAVMITGTLFTCVYNVLLLRKIDFTKSVGQNIRIVHTYKKNAKKQMIVIYTIIFIFLILCTNPAWTGPNVEPWRWAVMGVSLLGGLLIGYWEYKKIYKEKTKEILKSLEELRELEEE